MLNGKWLRYGVEIRKRSQNLIPCKNIDENGLLVLILLKVKMKRSRTLIDSNSSELKHLEKN